jgi:outer membrane receptor protein involved in Fe transport
MFDLPFSIAAEQFRLVGGARLEVAEQHVRVPKTLVSGGPVDETILRNKDILPSANLTYLMNPVTNLRITYSHSVNRPEFRELASTGFYDFIKYEMVGGNPDLRRALAQNFDVRVEVFPDPGEILAVSFFRKQIKDAIEEKLVQAATRTRTWFNSDDASNVGWEFEVRKSFSFFGDAGRMFSVTGNYTTIKSSVDVFQTIGNSTNTQTIKSTRPMQGQSPYIINLSLLFSNPALGTSVNLLYNKFGRRLDAVGFLAADVYEEPREIMDFAVTQPVSWGMEFKVTVKNLNNSARLLTRDGILYEKTRTGLTYSLQISKTL